MATTLTSTTVQLLTTTPTPEPTPSTPDSKERKLRRLRRLHRAAGTGTGAGAGAGRASRTPSLPSLSPVTPPRERPRSAARDHEDHEDHEDYDDSSYSYSCSCSCNSTDPRSSNQINTCVMFNIKILLLCIVISYVNESLNIMENSLASKTGVRVGGVVKEFNNGVAMQDMTSSDSASLLRQSDDEVAITALSINKNGLEEVTADQLAFVAFFTETAKMTEESASYNLSCKILKSNNKDYCHVGDLMEARPRKATSKSSPSIQGTTMLQTKLMSG